MIEKLVAVLRAAKLDPTAEEIADALWLAATAGPMTGIVGAEPQPSTQPKGDSTPKDATEATNQRDRSEAARNSEANAKGETPSGDLHQAMARAPAAPVGKRGVAVASPTASALPGALEIARALRPLKRRVPSTVHFEIDEEATARRMAEGAAEPIVMRPLRTRWLNLTLLVDEGPSMAIWQQTARELHALLEGHGAFGRVRRLGFVAEGRSKPRLFASCGGGTRSVRAKELIDSTGRSLLFVISDCVSDGWHDGRMAAQLSEWARRGPVGLSQVLPPRLWHRSALGDAMPVKVSADRPAPANSQLIVAKDEWWSSDDESFRSSTPLPVFSLERASIESWATMIAGGTGEGVGCVVLPASAEGEEGELETGALDEAFDPRGRVSRFRAQSSLKAQRLATLFAAAPYLSLPVMRLIRRVMLSDATLGHLAEVFLGGLLQEDGDDSGNPEYVRYRFAEGVRDILLESSDEASIKQVLVAVSDYATAHLGHKTSFRAILADPTGGGSEIIPENEASFARLGADILRRLGGEFQEIANRIGSRLQVAAKLPVVQRFVQGQSRRGAISIDDRFFEWAHEYESIRAHSPSNPTRTARLDDLFDAIRSFAATNGVPAAVALAAFQTKGDGMRIVALAIVAAERDPAGFEVVHAAIAEPRSSFEQWQALLLAQKLLPRLTLSQKLTLRRALVYQRSGAPGTIMRPETDRWIWSDELLQVLDAPNQIVLVLGGGASTLEAIERLIPSNHIHRSILLLSDYGLKPSPAGEILDWRVARQALERFIEDARGGRVSLPELHPHIYLVGEAPLPVLFHLGRSLPRHVEVTLYDPARADVGAYLHINPEVSQEPTIEIAPAASAKADRERVAVVIGDRAISKSKIRAFFAEHHETLSDVVEIRFDDQQASMGPTVRSTLAAIQLDSGLAKAAILGDRLALFLDGPPALAFLAGRALDAYRFRDVWITFPDGKGFVKAIEYGGSSRPKRKAGRASKKGPVSKKSGAPKKSVS